MTKQTLEVTAYNLLAALKHAVTRLEGCVGADKQEQFAIEATIAECRSAIAAAAKAR